MALKQSWVEGTLKISVLIQGKWFCNRDKLNCRYHSIERQENDELTKVM